MRLDNLYDCLEALEKAAPENQKPSLTALLDAIRPVRTAAKNEDTLDLERDDAATAAPASPARDQEDDDADAQPERKVTPLRRQ